MKKVFTSVDNDISVGVRKSFVYPDSLTLIISDKGRDEAQTAVLPNRDIPSLILALGEAAGVVPKWNSWSEQGTSEHLAHILSHLQQYVDAQEAIAAQAEETAKLEALAQELVNAYPTIVWEELTTMGKTRWLGVAAKALELGASVDN